MLSVRLLRHSKQAQQNRMVEDLTQKLYECPVPYFLFIGFELLLDI
jgi:hypothetical protein